MAEAVKVALVKDADFFQWLEGSAATLRAFDADAVAEMIRRCATLHLQHIAGGGDPFELGSSRPLDFGHWAAHKLESITSYRVRHGEAVAIGIALDTRYSVSSGLLPAGTERRVLELLRALGLPTFDLALDERHPDGRRVVFDGIDEFREHLGGDLTVMMLEGIGQGREVSRLDERLLDEAIVWLREYSASEHAPVPVRRAVEGPEREAAGG
jgi:3-dehydroquinate synthase